MLVLGVLAAGVQTTGLLMLMLAAVPIAVHFGAAFPGPPTAAVAWTATIRTGPTATDDPLPLGPGWVASNKRTGATRVIYLRLVVTLCSSTMAVSCRCGGVGGLRPVE